MNLIFFIICLNIYFNMWFLVFLIKYQSECADVLSNVLGNFVSLISCLLIFMCLSATFFSWFECLHFAAGLWHTLSAVRFRVFELYGHFVETLLYDPLVQISPKKRKSSWPLGCLKTCLETASKLWNFKQASTVGWQLMLLMIWWYDVTLWDKDKMYQVISLSFCHDKYYPPAAFMTSWCFLETSKRHKFSLKIFLETSRMKKISTPDLFSVLPAKR